MLETLFKRSKNGRIQQWTIEVVQNGYRTKEGFIDGVQTWTNWTTCSPKNVGRSNQTTAIDQALKEGTSKIKKQKEKGWVERACDIDLNNVISPMLAHKWDDYRSWIINQEYIASQPKLDGIRCIATKQGLFTRNGKKIVIAPHIIEEVNLILEKLPDDVFLDGELYNHKLKDDFNSITSIVRKQKINDINLLKSKKILQYHIYDIQYPNKTFDLRYELLKQLITDQFTSIVLVKTDFIKKEHIYQLDNLYAEYLNEGYEGQMIRSCEYNYENSRSKSLLKRKEFQDSEFTIIDIEEGKGNRSGMMGRIKFKDFDANACGNHAFFKEILKNKKYYIGKTATVKYQGFTPAGIPRFPVVIKIDRFDIN